MPAVVPCPVLGMGSSKQKTIPGPFLMIAFALLEESA